MLFNPKANLALERFDGEHGCYVIDDALVDPDSVVEFAATRRDDFRRAPSDAYPGKSLPTPPTLTRSLDELFAQRVRRLFDARRTLQTHCRLSMVTLAPAELRPDQWLCHRDGETLGPRHGRQACILYLFRDESLGGTKFFLPKRPAPEIAALFNDAKSLTAAEFAARHAVRPGYMAESNAYFECIGTVAPKWNRLIFYDGSMLHSGHIAAPERLSDDPRSGRLTLNGFFTCRRNIG